MTTLRINITKKVLEATKDCGRMACVSTKGCAIAYVIRSIWPDAIVRFSHIEPFGIQHFQEDWIDKFDRATPAERAAMQPFSFEIEVPDEVIGEVNIEEIRRICEGSKTLELVK